MSLMESEILGNKRFGGNITFTSCRFHQCSAASQAGYGGPTGALEVLFFLLIQRNETFFTNVPLTRFQHNMRICVQHWLFEPQVSLPLLLTSCIKTTEQNLLQWDKIPWNGGLWYNNSIIRAFWHTQKWDPSLQILVGAVPSEWNESFS